MSYTRTPICRVCGRLVPWKDVCAVIGLLILHVVTYGSCTDLQYYTYYYYSLASRNTNNSGRQELHGTIKATVRCMVRRREAVQQYSTPCSARSRDSSYFRDPSFFFLPWRNARSTKCCWILSRFHRCFLCTYEYYVQAARACVLVCW